MSRQAKPHHHYVLYGTAVRSEKSLGRLPEERGPKRPSLLIVKGTKSMPKSTKWYHAICDDSGVRVSSFGRVQNDFIVRFHRRADFVISKNGKRVTCRPRRGASDDEIQALLLTNIVPLALNQRGNEILHACAVDIDGRAVAFVGRQGHGKSTLSAAFVARGFHLLTDDALKVTFTRSKILAHPSFPEIRLEEKSMRRFSTKDQFKTLQRALFTKRRLPVSEFRDRPLPLEGIFIMDTKRKTGAVRVRPALAAETFRALLENSFRLDLFDSKRMERELKTLSRLAETIPAWVLSYPKSYEALDGAIEAVISSVGASRRQNV